MKYVFDHYALQYMLEQFPRSIAKDLWTKFENCCKDETIISQREAQKCLENECVEQASHEWCKINSNLFKPINSEEALLLGELMYKGEFDFLNNSQLVERRMPEAIPFILCIAKVQKRYYVYRKNTNLGFFPKIQQICKSHDIKLIEIEECLFNVKLE